MHSASENEETGFFGSFGQKKLKCHLNSFRITPIGGRILSYFWNNFSVLPNFGLFLETEKLRTTEDGNIALDKCSLKSSVCCQGCFCYCCFCKDKMQDSKNKRKKE